LMPDLGMPNNVGRMHGGFFTGALYRWISRVPIVPIDATVNVCGVSVFRVTKPITSRADFDQRILRAIERSRSGKATYCWNFDSGNHFIIYGRVRESDLLPSADYLVLHSSAGEFKRQHNGLYPVAANWYSDSIKVVIDDEASGRYLRYLEGTVAEKFFEKAS